jgi:hypothetical protein
MEVDQDLFHAAAAEPVRLCFTGEVDALRREALVFGKLEVYRRCRPVHVPVLGEGKATQLGAEHGERDIFEVVVGAIGPAEERNGSVQVSQRCQSWYPLNGEVTRRPDAEPTMRACQQQGSVCRGSTAHTQYLPALRSTDAMPSLLTSWSAMVRVCVCGVKERTTGAYLRSSLSSQLLHPQLRPSQGGLAHHCPGPAKRDVEVNPGQRVYPRHDGSSVGKPRPAPSREVHVVPAS